MLSLCKFLSSFISLSATMFVLVNEDEEIKIIIKTRNLLCIIIIIIIISLFSAVTVKVNYYTYTVGHKNVTLLFLR